jgi:hypothetical protein
MTTDRAPVIVIGGGGAGLLASCRAASLGAEVLLLERNHRTGIKLLISGGGKCNITHEGSVEDLLRAFLPREARFLKHALYRFTNEDVLALLRENGVATSARPDGRVFPLHGTAKDVVRAFEQAALRAGVHVRTEARVESVRRAVTGELMVGLSGTDLPASAVILATGGVSYPKTGTTGDGFAWARLLGHTIVPLRPALAPIPLFDPLPAGWRGVAVRGGEISVWQNGKAVAVWRGDILFTHEGVSGPAALEVSRTAAVHREAGAVELRFDFFPGWEFADLDVELNSILRAEPGRQVSTVLDRWLPNRLVEHLLMGAGVDPAMRCSVVMREQRRAIVHRLKSWRIGRVGDIPITRGEVTAGGISLDEVNPRTMASRGVPGLFLCGEILDIAGPVGGYNLQAAFSTGCVAGESAARAWAMGNSKGSDNVIDKVCPHEEKGCPPEGVF